MTIEEMRERKRELGYTYEQIAELANLPVTTVQKVLGKITKSPRYDTLAALERVLNPAKANMVKESVPNYYVKKKQGEYTTEDYYRQPEDEYMELIDGVFYDMSAPSHLHQLLSGEIYSVFRDYIRKNKGDCIPAYAPLDVQLNGDDKTMVQPDVIIVCDRSKFHQNSILGAPDLIVEILSPATKKKDMFIKAHKYLDAGVREYWLVDPERKRVMVYNYEDKEYAEYPAIYTFENEVPVHIFDGKCIVDFKEISEYLQFLYK